MANVLLGATGSVAAIRVPALFEALAKAGHAVKVVATDAATYFFDPASLGESLIRDADEYADLFAHAAAVTATATDKQGGRA